MCFKKIVSVVAAVAFVSSALFFGADQAATTVSGKMTLVSYETICRNIDLNGSPSGFAISPHMTVPVCYDGSSIWQNGNVTGWVNTVGYTLEGIDWTGTYNSGGDWIGAGMDYRVTLWNDWIGFGCPTRWIVDANANVLSYDRNC